MKILSPWPWPQGHLRGGDGADKNFRPISTIRPNMNEIHQRVFKNFDPVTERPTNEWTYVRTNEWKSENYIPQTYEYPHIQSMWGV